MSGLIARMPTKIHNLIFNLTGYMLVEFFTLDTNEHVKYEWRHHPDHEPRDLWFR